ncbi:MAG: flippase-like domain-containing protein [Bryobacteraceae bacterium]|nr:flippase-like domain-containing protein [Solibacteraceae bacterium]MCL4793513.1 flippase-like domain-containing protein [Bryobacteraceae bacterium]
MWLGIRWRGEDGFDVSELLEVWRKADVRWLLASLMIMLGSYYGRALRWAVLLEPLRPRPSLWGLFKATAIGYTAIILLGRPGELVRPYLIASREQVPFSSQMAAWLIERICDLLLVLVLFGLALALVTGGPERRTGPVLEWALRAGGWAAAGLGLVCLAVFAGLSRWSHDLGGRLRPFLDLLSEGPRKRADGMLASLEEGFGSTRSSSAVARLLGWSILEWAIVVSGYFAVFRAFSSTAEMRLGEVLIFIGFVSFGSIIQIPGVGGGMQVAAAVVLVELFGLRIEEAAGIAVAIWVTAFVGIVPAGLLLALQDGVNFMRMRDLDEEVGRT